MAFLLNNDHHPIKPALSPTYSWSMVVIYYVIPIEIQYLFEQKTQGSKVVQLPSGNQTWLAGKSLPKDTKGCLYLGKPSTNCGFSS